jgi:hypothetical protein
MILRTIEGSPPWSRVQELLDGILRALSEFDRPRALQILGEC